MGAFWHLYVPVKVNVTMDKNEIEAIGKSQTVLPEPFAKDFFEISRNERSVEYEHIGTRHKIDLVYMLSDENMNQIKPFLTEAWQLAKAEDSLITAKGLDDFIQNNLDSLNITRASLATMDEQLDDFKDNYYLYYESIPSMVVYNGWPDELRSRSRSYSMEGFTFLHSHEKMNVIPEETVLFYNLKDKIKKELLNEYTIAKYLYILGF